MTDFRASGLGRAALSLLLAGVFAGCTVTTGAVPPATPPTEKPPPVAPSAVPPTALPPKPTVAAATATPSGPDYSPKVQSVWDTKVGADQMRGCSGGSLLPAYGLVQVTPDGETLTWKNTEPKPYVMKKIGPGQWRYEGPTSLDDGTVKMVVTFTGEKTLTMSRSFIPKGEPGCTHMHEYTGEYKWDRP